METKKYIVGIIKDDNKNVGVALFNMKDRKVKIKSLQSVIDKYLTGEKIVGLREKKTTVVINKDTYNVKDYIYLSQNYFDTRKLPVIDCNGNVLIPGADVCVGTVGIENDKKYIVVNSKGELRLLTKEEVILCQDLVQIKMRCSAC